MNYIHACNFTVNTDAKFKIRPYFARQISLEKFTINDIDHYAKLDIQKNSSKKSTIGKRI